MEETESTPTLEDLLQEEATLLARKQELASELDDRTVLARQLLPKRHSEGSRELVQRLDDVVVRHSKLKLGLEDDMYRLMGIYVREDTSSDSVLWARIEVENNSFDLELLVDDSEMAVGRNNLPYATHALLDPFRKDGLRETLLDIRTALGAMVNRREQLEDLLSSRYRDYVHPTPRKERYGAEKLDFTLAVHPPHHRETSQLQLGVSLSYFFTDAYLPTSTIVKLTGAQCSKTTFRRQRRVAAALFKEHPIDKAVARCISLFSKNSADLQAGDIEDEEL